VIDSGTPRRVIPADATIRTDTYSPTSGTRNEVEDGEEEDEEREVEVTAVVCGRGVLLKTTLILPHVFPTSSCSERLREPKISDGLYLQSMKRDKPIFAVTV
tara:strand:- start:414 stop:719 length:306 start_codon:yes stop_codon:yes gene_type:complete